MNAFLKIREINSADAKDLFDWLNNLDEGTKRFFHPHSFDIKTIKNISKNQKDHYFTMRLDDKLVGYSFLRLFGYSIPSLGKPTYCR